jgi:hypothetical protein
MSTSGLSTGTVNGSPVAVGDGVDDEGLASGPETLPTTGNLSIAVTVSGGSQSSPGNIVRADTDASARFGMFTVDSSSPQRLSFIVQDKNLDTTQVETSTGQIDGSAQLLLVTKSGDNPADIDLFVDDMETPKPQNIIKNGGYQNAEYVPGVDMGFFCRNTDFTGTTDFLDFQAGRFQFFDSALSETERKNVKARTLIV